MSDRCTKQPFCLVDADCCSRQDFVYLAGGGKGSGAAEKLTLCDSTFLRRPLCYLDSGLLSGDWWSRFC